MRARDGQWHIRKRWLILLLVLPLVLVSGCRRVTLVTNSLIYGDTITNYSAEDLRRIDMVFGIAYEDDIEQARQLIESTLKADERVLDEPAATVAVSELADSSVNFVVRPWVKKEDYWGVKFDLTRQIKETFDENGIDIPYPQQVIHRAPASDSE